MKKLVFLGAMVMIMGGVALASSLSVPYWLDDGAIGWPPATGTASYISIVNNAATPVTLWVTYTDDAGRPMTPNNNSFVLPANSCIAWRPMTTDPSEGEDTGSLVPDAVAPSAAPATKWGSAVITWDGDDATKVQGFLQQVQAASKMDTGMYTLPLGK